MDSSIKSVNIIGSGNVGTQLALRLWKQGLNINQIFSRSLNNATLLAEKVDSVAIDNLDNLEPADMNLLMVKDDVIEEIANHSKLENQFLVHTSGTISLDTLKSDRSGVFYPLQTFTKDKTANWKEIPLLIEASSEEGKDLLTQLANEISDVVRDVNSVERKSIHLAAVFVSNFVNHLFVVAEDLLKKNNLDFDILKPLIFEQVLKIKDNPPLNIQTGPAKRGDRKIIGEHINLLADHPEYAAIYDLLSKSIIKRHGN